jgi:hypothetical protein
MSSEGKKENNESLVNIAKLLGEFLLLPGTSLLADGKLKKGFLHVGAGVVAGLLLGIPGAALVAANSFSMSKTDKNLLGLLMNDKKKLASGRTHLQELEAKVKEQVKSGRNLNEIKAGLLEDLEDIFAEESCEKAD